MVIFICSFLQDCIVHTKIDEVGDFKAGTTICGNVCCQNLANVLWLIFDA